jgi:triosephosphate isomerase
VSLCVPATLIERMARVLNGSAVIVGGQDHHSEAEGPFTGDVSAEMLAEAGARQVILGHSERRGGHGESDELTSRKTEAALRAGLEPIVCVGETLAEREAGRTLEVVERQIRAVLKVLADAPRRAAIAYEPVWAIGTGKNAGPAEAQEVHQAIRGWLASSTAALALETRILYGGSVKPDNARDLLAAPDVDGALVGGASLDAASFGAIVQAAELLAAR